MEKCLTLKLPIYWWKRTMESMATITIVMILYTKLRSCKIDRRLIRSYLCGSNLKHTQNEKMYL